MPFTLNTEGSVIGQADELKPQKISGTVSLCGKGHLRAYHTVSLFDEFGGITPGPLEDVVEGSAQVLVVLSRLVVQEFL